MLAFANLVQEHTTLILCLRLLCGTSYLTLHSSVDYCELCRQLEELQQQCSAQQTEIRRLYDWKDVMKTAHNEHLQELASKHQVDRDTLLADISHRYPPLCFAAYFAHQDQPVRNVSGRTNALHVAVIRSMAEIIWPQACWAYAC